jgi:hypothetical protein
MFCLPRLHEPHMYNVASPVRASFECNPVVLETVSQYKWPRVGILDTVIHVQGGRRRMSTGIRWVTDKGHQNPDIRQAFMLSTQGASPQWMPGDFCYAAERLRHQLLSGNGMAVADDHLDMLCIYIVSLLLPLLQRTNTAEEVAASR